MEKINTGDASPLGPNHPRFGTPTPQDGVQVTKKWARADSVFPAHERAEDGNV